MSAFSLWGNAQAPFGPNIPNANQTPTPDNFLSNIPLTIMEGSGGGGGCRDDIQRTGNDFQTFDNGSKTIEVMVWDGNCPGFSLIVRDNFSPFNFITAWGADLNGTQYGKITDPDIVVSQSDVTSGNLAIMIVYVLDGPSDLFGNGSNIAYEEYTYDYLLDELTLNVNSDITNAANVISNNEASSPNIDANDDNQIVITFEEREEIFTYANQFSSPATVLNPGVGMSGPNTNLNNKLNISNNLGLQNYSFLTPDVSIADISNNGITFSSYVFVDQYGNLILVQEDINDLLNNVTSASFNNIQIDRETKNPRISSPPSDYISNDWECAITAEYKSGATNQIGVYFNRATSSPFDFSRRSLNRNFSGNSLIDGCINTFPAISYTFANDSEASIAVAWTVEICDPQSLYFQSEDVISANLNLNSLNRTPFDSDYFMLVCLARKGKQHAVSVAGESDYSQNHEESRVFYSLVSNDDMVFKTSDVIMQPHLRKKAETTEILVSSIEDINVYPNPTKGEINIKGNTKFSNYYITNTVGSIIVEGSNLDLVIDVNNVENGLYFITFLNQNGDKIETKKIIKN